MAFVTPSTSSSRKSIPAVLAILCIRALLGLSTLRTDLNTAKSVPAPVAVALNNSSICVSCSAVTCMSPSVPSLCK